MTFSASARLGLLGLLLLTGAGEGSVAR